MKDIADIREELSEELKATEEERATRQIRERFEAEALARAYEKMKVIRKLVPHLAKTGRTVAYSPDKATLSIDAVDVSNRFYLEDEYRKTYSRFRNERTGKVSVYVYVEDYRYNRNTRSSYPHDSRRRFPQRKDGSHNYEQIAELLVDYVKSKLAREELERVKAANEATAAAVRKATGMNDYGGRMSVRASTDPKLPVHVKVEFGWLTTAEKATKLHALLKEAGIIKEGSY